MVTFMQKVKYQAQNWRLGEQTGQGLALVWPPLTLLFWPPRKDTARPQSMVGISQVEGK